MARLGITFLFIIMQMLTIASFSHAQEIEGYGDHSLWVLVNDVKESFTEDTGIPIKLIGEFAIGGKGCDKGIVHASKGSPDRDFGLICCGISDEILKDYGLVEYPVAREPLAIIVNEKNPVKSLSLLELRKIFSGKITNWKEVGGRDEGIIVITRLHCSKYTPNWMKILGAPEMFSEKKLNVNSQADMSRTVSDYPQAIGHLEMASLFETPDGLKALKVNGYLPSSENIKSGLYPLYSDQAVVTKGEAGGSLKKFIMYLRTSEKVANVMKRYGMYQIGN